MSQDKTHKKLNLKRETLRVLVDEQLDKVIGGGAEPAPPTYCDRTCYPTRCRGGCGGLITNL